MHTLILALALASMPAHHHKIPPPLPVAKAVGAIKRYGLKPEQVFTERQLDAWARQHGYIPPAKLNSEGDNWILHGK